MNAGEFGRANQWTTMSSSSNASIAKKARTKAEADFATWLMMAKLGGFDDLPSNAQSFLTNYRARLEAMGEAEFDGPGRSRGLQRLLQRDGRRGRGAGTKGSHTNDRGQSRPERGSTPFDEANDPKIPLGAADFHEHGGFDCRI